jgi:2-oxo-hept-3-ene-1,7-dioate hydratase
MSTTLSAAEIASAAARIDAAERTRVACRQITLDHPAMTMADAYAVQSAWMALKTEAGRRRIGHKIGLTSRAMQKAVNIDQPDSGMLLDDMLYREGSTIPADRFLQLKIEAELAFILDKPLSGPNCSLFDVLDATAYVTPALEILDARIQRLDPQTGRARTVLDTISDNAANAALVLGGRAFKPNSANVDLRRIGAVVSCNGEVEETGLAAGVLNHPAYGIAWLANRLHTYGATLQAGDVVLAGSFIRPIDVVKGDTIVADYGEFGSVACHFG